MKHNSKTMKFRVLLTSAATLLASYAQAQYSGVLVQPSHSGNWDTVYLSVNTNLTCPRAYGNPDSAKSLATATILRYHGGVCLKSGNSINNWLRVRDASATDTNTHFRPVAGMPGMFRKMIVPATYFTTLTPTDTVVGLSFVINGGPASSIWDKEGKVCNGYSSAGGGAGDHIVVFATINPAYLTTSPQAGSSISRTICQGSSYPFGTRNLDVSGTYTNTIHNVLGYDSIVTLTLTVTPAIAASISRMICEGSSLQFGSRSLDAAGSYINLSQSAIGCDSIITLTLTVNPLPTTALITQSHDTLYASSTGTHYQWYRGQTLLIGDTMHYYKTNYRMDSYRVISTLNSCSSPFSLVFTDTKSRVSNFLKLYPNPANSYFTIEVANSTTVQVLNALGKLVISQKVSGTTQLNTSQLASGMYTVIAEGYKATSLVVSK